MERHIVENDIRHRSRYTVHIPKADGKGTAVVKLRDMENSTECEVARDQIAATLLNASKVEGGN